MGGCCESNNNKQVQQSPPKAQQVNTSKQVELNVQQEDTTQVVTQSPPKNKKKTKPRPKPEPEEEKKITRGEDMERYTYQDFQKHYSHIKHGHHLVDHILKGLKNLRKKVKHDFEKDFCHKIEDEFEKIKKHIKTDFKDAEHHLRRCFSQLLENFLSHLNKLVLEGQHHEIKAMHLYQMLRTLPILDKLLPPHPSVQPPKSEFTFSNWSLSVFANPKIFELKNVFDIKNMLQMARKNNKRVRIVNFTHTFSPQYADDDQYLGYMIPKKFISTDPEPLNKLQKYSDDLMYTWYDESQFMYCKLHIPKNLDPKGFWGVTVGGGTSNVVYTNLCQKRFHKNLPFPSEIANVVQYYQGWTGTTANSCHGAGKNTTNTSVYVTEMTLINWKGETVVYKDEELKKVCAHFGLLGVVIEIKIRMHPQYYCLFYPEMQSFEKCFDGMSNQIATWYYTEYFWAPTTEKIFNNSWHRIPATKLKEISEKENLGRPKLMISKGSKSVQLFALNFIQLLDMAVPMPAKGLGAYVYNLVLCKFIKFGWNHLFDLLPKNPKHPTVSYNGIHYAWGIQNQRIWDTEIYFPLPPATDENGEIIYEEVEENGEIVRKPKGPDASLCEVLSKVAIEHFKEYKKKDLYVQNLPLEFRVMRGNEGYNMLVAGGVAFAVAIEILTRPGTQFYKEKWYQYQQELVTKWIKAYADYDKYYYPKFGLKYVRPHWGKHWQGLKIFYPKENEFKTIYQHLKFCYGDEIDNFNQIRNKADPYNMFVNKGLAPIYGVNVSKSPQYPQD